MSAPLAPSRCPLCGQENDCGMVKGSATCWCFDVKIPREVLDRVPAEAQGCVCVCKACAAGSQTAATVSLHRKPE